MIDISHETQVHNTELESVIIMIDMSHETQNHNITLESVIIMIDMSHEIRNHKITLESNYYDWHVIKRDKVQRKSSVALIDFYGTYDPHKRLGSHT